MSWVTDVLLCLNLEERLDDEGSFTASCKPLEEINSWLSENQLGTLAELSIHMETGGKAVQAFVYGGSFNHLDMEKFKGFVFSRHWQFPEAVQLLLNDEQDVCFKLYTSNA